MPRKPKQNVKPNEMKRGKMSNPELALIRELMDKQPPEQIAKKIRRTAAQVERAIEAIKGVAPVIQMSLEEQLMRRPEWARFQKQFNEDELIEFRHQYVQIMSQLRSYGDVLPTEELQVFHVVSLKINIDRTGEELKQAIDQMNESLAELDILRREGEDADTSKIAFWHDVYRNAQKMKKECSEQYKTYSDKQDKMLNTLKATRDQRIKNWETADKSIIGLVRLLVEEENRRSLGDEAELMRLACEKEKERLSSPHTYSDGVVDLPILTPETVTHEDYDA